MAKGEGRESRWAGEDLVVFEVAGLRRVRGGGVIGAALVVSRRSQGQVVMSKSVRCVDDAGGGIVVTSHRRDSDDRYEQTRDWATVNPYLATPEGRAAAARWARSAPLPRPPVHWRPVTLDVDGQATPFEVCDVGPGRWVGVGAFEDVVVSIDSQRVALGRVALTRGAGGRYPPPPTPEVGENTAAVLTSLDDRFERLPIKRVRRYPDYWALRAIEAEHTQKLAQRMLLSASESDALRFYWLERIDADLGETLDSWDESRRARMHRSHPMARRLGTGAVFQLWNNTIGPGGRTWFGNRYASIRPHTFRVRWRP